MLLLGVYPNQSEMYKKYIQLYVRIIYNSEKLKKKITPKPNNGR